MAVKDTNPKDAVAQTKVPLMLLSGVAKVAWCVAQFCGAAKYGAWNWRGTEVVLSVYLSAMERHIEGLKAGEWHDPEDGTTHLGNIMACAAIILDAKACGKLIDDRPPANAEYRQALAEAVEQMKVIKEKYAHMKPHHYTIADTDRIKKGE